MSTEREGILAIGYVYDKENGLTKVTNPDGSLSTYSYGTNGLRAPRQEPGTAVATVIWDGVDILQERSPGVVNLLTVDSQILSLNDANLNQFDFVVDQLGSVNGLMDLYSETFAKWRWSPYGRFIDDAFNKDFIINYGWVGSWGTWRPGSVLRSGMSGRGIIQTGRVSG